MTSPGAAAVSRRTKRAAKTRASAKPSRERMIEATAALLQKQGYAGTGLAEILAVSGAPRGSLYFHFPGGKEQLACEALAASGAMWKKRFEAISENNSDPAAAVDAVCTFLGDELEASGWELGCPIATVALEAVSASEAIRKTCADHYNSLEEVVRVQLVAAGYLDEVARVAATLAVSSIEGALLLSRVHRSRAPLDRVSLALQAQISATKRLLAGPR